MHDALEMHGSLSPPHPHVLPPPIVAFSIQHGQKPYPAVRRHVDVPTASVYVTVRVKVKIKVEAPNTTSHSSSAHHPSLVLAVQCRTLYALGSALCAQLKLRENL